jgi:hypothetical protein
MQISEDEFKALTDEVRELREQLAALADCHDNVAKYTALLMAWTGMDGPGLAEAARTAGRRRRARPSHLRAVK